MDVWLPLVFLVVMGLAMLAYVVLDGYDLGVGILLRRADDAHKETLIASIGPFWDANETWLVLGVGILLTAFPRAHGVILGALYLPVALMLIGLVLRGVAFDFRVKARAAHKPLWDRTFWAGSLLAAWSQGYMLGLWITGFERNWATVIFAIFIGAALAAGYALLGAGWLIARTEGELQRRAVAWARGALLLTALGVAAVSVATPLVSESVSARWFAWPRMAWLMPIPLATASLFVVAYRALRTLPRPRDQGRWIPFACTVGIFMLAFAGLAYSAYPYLVMDRITIWDAASAPESLRVILYGALVTLPAIVVYTVISYRVFRGKATELRYY